jgi:hypothetical protein
MTRVVPDSCCRKSCVLRAMRALKSVGRARASSKLFVWRLCVWPWVAAIARCSADDVVVRVLRRQRPARRLAVRAQRERLGVFGLKGFMSRPTTARGAQLGDFHEEVHADGPEERQPRREGVDAQAGLDAAGTYSTPSASV